MVRLRGKYDVIFNYSVAIIISPFLRYRFTNLSAIGFLPASYASFGTVTRFNLSTSVSYFHNIALPITIDVRN